MGLRRQRPDSWTNSLSFRPLPFTRADWRISPLLKTLRYRFVGPSDDAIYTLVCMGSCHDNPVSNCLIRASLYRLLCNQIPMKHRSATWVLLVAVFGVLFLASFGFGVVLAAAVRCLL